MAQDDEVLSDYELGRRDALAEAEERSADKRIEWAEFKELQRQGAPEAAALLASGGVKVPGYIQRVLDANQEERGKLLGSSFDPRSPVPVSDYEQAVAERALQDRGFTRE